MLIIAGFYPCLLCSSRLHKEEVAVSEAQRARHKLPHLVVLPQQHSLHLKEGENKERGESYGKGKFYIICGGVDMQELM